MEDTLARAVEGIRRSIPLASLDESATKQSVVLRLLTLSGWNPFDPSQVVPEYTVGARRVDFALLPNSANAVFVEVKRASENLEKHQQQLLEYCFQEGVKLAVLTNGRIWWLYLPLQPGSWEHRRFITINLEAQDPERVQDLFVEFLSHDNVTEGLAIAAAENLVQSQQQEEIATRAIVQAWKQIVETPDELLVDLISETTERICGFKPQPGLIQAFLTECVSPLLNLEAPSYQGSPDEGAQPPSRRTTDVGGRSATLPITLEPEDSQIFKDALLQTKEAWIEVSYLDGRKQVRRWDASRMAPSSNVMGNLRSRPEFRSGNWQQNGIVSLRVTIERPQ